MMIEEESVSDDSGNVTVITSVADDVVLPVTMILKGREDCPLPSLMTGSR